MAVLAIRYLSHDCPRLSVELVRSSGRPGFAPHDLRVVSVPKTLTPQQAIEAARTLALTDAEYAEFCRTMEGFQVCADCGSSKPAWIVGYSSTHTGQIGERPYCDTCMRDTYASVEPYIRSWRAEPFPGSNHPSPHLA